MIERPIPAGCAHDFVCGPPFPELGTNGGNFVRQAQKPRVGGMSRRFSPELTDDSAGMLLPVDQRRANPRHGEHRPEHIPLMWCELADIAKHRG